VKVIGLMSGTSADGVDAALVEIHRDGDRPAIRLLAQAGRPYPAGLRERVLALASGGATEEVCHLNAYLGELFAEAALAIAEAAGVPLDAIDLIGSHGQTIQHLPLPRREGVYAVRSTLQIGAAAVIAERTGVTTIADFRPRDMAAGGEGAPLTPLVHQLLFGHPERARAILNLGGIANVTVLPAGRDASGVLGFDTGPANVLLDEFVKAAALSPLGYDEDGRLAAGGAVQPDLLAELMAHPFIRRCPPKSTGREEFGPALAQEILARVRASGRRPEDGLATLAAFTVAAVAENVRVFVLPRTPVQELIVMGGGARNPVLVRGLAGALPGCAVRPAEEVGIPARAVEAMTFAVLAYLTATGSPGNLPAVTGATGPRVLGCIVPGRRFKGLGGD
jgi:anhydro-N-acetylmuramic acid kinase